MKTVWVFKQRGESVLNRIRIYSTYNKGRKAIIEEFEYATRFDKNILESEIEEFSTAYGKCIRARVHGDIWELFEAEVE